MTITFALLFPRYEEKRWVPRDGKWKSPPKNQDDKAENLSEDRTHLKANIVKESVPASRTNIPTPTKEPEQVSHFHLEKKQIIPKQSSDALFPLLKPKKGKHGRHRDKELQYNPTKHLPLISFLHVKGAPISFSAIGCLTS